MFKRRNNVTDQSGSTNKVNEQTPKGSKAAKIAKRTAKWLGITLASLIVLILILISAVIWILTPERLTPLVEKYGSEYIDGELHVKRIELTFWSTFPHFNVDVDSMVVVSHSMRGLTAEEQNALPKDATKPFTIKGFHGDINLLYLLKGEIALRDIILDHPTLTLVDVRPCISNYNIFPPPEEKDEEPLSIPNFSFSNFMIKGTTPIRYVSLSDNIDTHITLEPSNISGEKAPTYRLRVDADAGAEIGSITLDGLHLGAGGDILWKRTHPYRVELRQFKTSLNNITTVTDAVIDFEKELAIERFNIKMPEVAINEFIAVIPKNMRGELAKIRNNLKLEVNASLYRRYVPSATSLPPLDFSVRMPKGVMDYDRLHLSALTLDLSGHIDNIKPDLSTVSIHNLYAAGEGVTFSLKGDGTQLFTDPRMKGTMRGTVDLAAIPKVLTQKMGLTISGNLIVDALFEGSQSYLTRENFHRLRLEGDASLHNLRVNMPEMALNVWMRNIEMQLGTANKFVRNSVVADSLLTASIKIDTVAGQMTGMSLNGGNLKLGAGIRNVAQSASRDLITPLGASMVIGRLNLMAIEQPSNPFATGAAALPDTTILRLRDIHANASLKRFKDQARVPEMAFDINAKRIRYADRLNRISLKQPLLSVLLHPQAPKTRNSRLQARIDSLHRLYPTLPQDSLAKMARNLRKNRGGINEGSTQMDFGVDDDTRSLLRKWNASGHITAERARLLTPYYPIRNVLSNLDMRFNNDSIIIKNTRYRGGRSDFTFNGTLSNLTRALTSKSKRQPLRLTMSIVSDTIDVNELAAAAFAGAAFAQKQSEGSGFSMPDIDNDDAMQEAITMVADPNDAGPLLIPTNLQGNIRLTAKYVVYENFLFNTMRGSAEIYDGALNLRDLRARTQMGSIDLNALYQGVKPDSLSFAFGVRVHDFHIGRFLALFPSLDSVMPLLKDVDGVINGSVAATTDLAQNMDLKIPTLAATVALEGDSLRLLDAETFRKIGKWLLFKRKNRNIIDHMSVKLVVKNSIMELFPFIFDIDRYKLGVMGSNDMDLNFKYHVSVLKSPIPFKFGINISGNPDKMKIRLGGAKVKSEKVAQQITLNDSTRINLIEQIDNVFRRGVTRARERLKLNSGTSSGPKVNLAMLKQDDDDPTDTISAADKQMFINEGLLPKPPELVPVFPQAPVKSTKKAK